MTYTPIYAPFDLCAFDKELAGNTIQLLQNPTRSFRRQFFVATGQPFLDAIAFICNISVDAIETTFGDYEETLFAWLFIPQRDGEKWILPHVYDVWDGFTSERIKKLNAPPTS